MDLHILLFSEFLHQLQAVSELQEFKLPTKILPGKVLTQPPEEAGRRPARGRGTSRPIPSAALATVGEATHGDFGLGLVRGRERSAEGVIGGGEVICAD